MEDASTDRHHLFLEFQAKLIVKNMHLNVAVSVGYTPDYFKMSKTFSHVSKQST